VADVAGGATGNPVHRRRMTLTISEAADVLWATNSSELYVLMTAERGWSVDRYERWLAATWARRLL
jgi:hypothetical protein